MSDNETVGSVNLLDVITSGRQLPDGYDGWLLRTVRPDFRSSNDYRYPFPGQVAKAPGPIEEWHKGACPHDIGDGICAATTWQGMASGGVPASTLLLVAYRQSDVLGRDSGEGKLRLREFLIVDVVDGVNLVRESGRYANLRYANLRYANLGSADLGSADLRYANLGSANLRYADLRYANLGSANLRYANLRYADLGSADLGSADLGSADLRSAVGLTSEQLRYAYTDRWTQLPTGLVVPASAA